MRAPCALWALAVLVALAGSGRARAQAPDPTPPAIDLDLYFTVAVRASALPDRPGMCDFSALKTVHLTGADVSSLVLSGPRTVTTLTPFVPGRPVFDADGRLLTPCTRNIIVRYDPSRGLTSPLTACTPAGPAPGTGPAPNLLTLAADPSADRAWAVTDSPMAAPVTVLPQYAPASGGATISGDDTRITSVAFTLLSEFDRPLRRVFYAAQTPVDAADPGGPVTRSLGFVNLASGQTSRLFGDLPAARALAFDPYTGHLMAAGSRFIAQVDCTLPTPRIVALLDLGAAAPGVGDGADVVDIASDGRGRLYAVTGDGRLFVVQHRRPPSVNAPPASARIDDALTRVRVLELQPAPAPGGDDAAYPFVRGLAPLSGPGGAQAGECLWDNGPADGRSGQLSQVNIDEGDAHTADDFYLLPDTVYRLDTVTATLATDSPVPNKARLDLYSDCNGRPAESLGTFETSDLTDTGRELGGYRLYTARFELGGVLADGGHTGRSLWLSVRGVGLGSGTEQWFWSTAGSGAVNGAPGVFRSEAAGMPEWTPIVDFGCGCSDFAFTVRGRACKVLVDGGAPDPAAAPLGALSQIASLADSARAADDLVVPPSCERSRTVCYLRAYLYSNCTPVRGRFELYTDACHSPRQAAGEPVDTAAFTRVTDLGITTVVDNIGLTLYRVEAYGMDWSLAPGRNYWVAPVGDTSLALHRRNLAAFGARCDAACLSRFEPARGAGRGVGHDAWLPITDARGQSRSLAMLVAIDEPETAATSIGSRPVCLADMDRSGTVTLEDLLAFLQAWFAGCP